MDNKLYNAYDQLYMDPANKEAVVKRALELLDTYDYAIAWFDESTRYQKCNEPNVFDEKSILILKHVDSTQSKSGRKKLIKRFEKTVKMHEKRLVAEEKAKSSSSSSDFKKIDTSHMSSKEYMEYRRQSFKTLDIEMYPHKFKTQNWISFTDFIDKYNHLKNDELLQESKYLHSIGGQVILKRGASKKLFFFTLESEGTELQMMANFMYYGDDKEQFRAKCELVCRGDRIGVIGYPYRSKTGELTIMCQSFEILAPCLVNLPKVTKNDEGENVCNFISMETRMRRRYQDFKVNLPSRNVIATRSKITRLLREYLNAEDFMEIETPILNQKASGASAKPFVTHCNDLKTDMHLRIAPELKLKRLLVGGFDRVYEVGRQFRNESIDLTHCPEFTTCEFYEAYADYNDIMNRTEDLVTHILTGIHGKMITDYTTSHLDSDGNEVLTDVKIDWTPPYKRIDIMEELPKEIRLKGIEFDWHPDMFSQEANVMLRTTIVKLGLECEEPQTTPRLLDKLIGEFLECKCHNPTFLINHPQAMSPLAKYHRSIPQASERFELFVLEKELCNAFTELNDPQKQLELFQAQNIDRTKGDDEAPEPDHDYILSLETGLVPCGGWGMGIDRLVMFMTNNRNIKEVIAFPLIKPE